MIASDLKQYIYENDKVGTILEQIGCSHVSEHENSKGSYWSAANPDGDNTGAINIYNNPYLNYVNYTRGVSYDEHQDILSLIQTVKGTDFVKTLKLIHAMLGIPFTYANKKPVKKDDGPNPLDIFTKHKSRKKTFDVGEFNVIDEAVLGEFVDKLYIGWLREGILPLTAKKFGLEFSYKWNRVIVPHRYWQTGELMGYNARTTIEDYEALGIKKYFLTPGMDKSINLYGLYENYDSIQKAHKIVVGEAEKSVLKRNSLLDPTWVALSGKTISDEQVRIILGLDIDEIVIALDSDVPEEEIWNICEKFFRLRKVSYIYDKGNLLGPKDSPADASEKIYMFLYKNRIVYTEAIHKKYLASLGKK